jgi:hypothetical protein
MELIPEERNTRASAGQISCQTAMTLAVTRLCLTDHETMSYPDQMWPPPEFIYDWDCNNSACLSLYPHIFPLYLNL